MICSQKIGESSKIDLVFISIITIAIALAETATDIYIPAMPAIAYEFCSTVSKIKYTISFYLLSVSLGGLFQGPLSDRYGRRPIFIIFLFLFFGATIACSLANSIGLLIAYRCIQGISASAALSVGMASLRDIFTGVRFAIVMSKIGFIIAVSPGLAPVLGAYLNVHCGWRGVFLCQAIMIFLLFISAWIWYRETTIIIPVNNGNSQTIRASYLYVLHNKTFMVFAVIQSMVFSSLFIEVSSLPFLYINHYNIKEEYFGFYMAFSVFWYAIGTIINQMFLRPVGLRKMIIIGLIFQIITCCLIVFISLFVELNPIGIHCLKIPGSIGLALVFGNATPQALSAISKSVGAGAALITFLQMILAGGMVLASGFLPDNSPISIYLPYLLLIITCFLILANTHS